MNVDFTARRMTIDLKVQKLIEKKLEKLAKVLPADAQAHVIARAEKKAVAIEITIVGRQRTWTATESADDQDTAARAALERIEAQAKKATAKVKEEKKRHPSPVRAHALAEAEPKRPAPRREPHRESATARPMFEEDALNTFSGSGKDVMVYRDAADKSAFRVLYRRRDGTLGLLIPN